jgi:predicted amidophosphoribosyltransferase
MGELQDRLNKILEETVKQHDEMRARLRVDAEVERTRMLEILGDVTPKPGYCAQCEQPAEGTRTFCQACITTLMDDTMKEYWLEAKIRSAARRNTAAMRQYRKEYYAARYRAKRAAKLPVVPQRAEEREEEPLIDPTRIATRLRSDEDRFGKRPTG